MKRMPRKRATRCQMAELVAKKCRSTTGETIVGGHLGRLHFLAVFHVDRGSAAQVGPVNVGAQVFAADGSLCGALNSWAMVGRDVSTRQPVIDNLRNNANGSRQNALAAETIYGLSECFHGDHHKHVGIARQQAVFDLVNN